MEDAHSFVYDYAGVRGQGYFAVFEWVGLILVVSRTDDLAVMPENTRRNGVAKTSTR